MEKDLKNESSLALQKKMFSACIDSVGGQNLVFILKRLTDGGTCYSVGFSQFNEFSNINLTAFILRGIKLVGIHAESIKFNTRNNVWSKIASFNKIHKLTNHIFKDINFKLLKKVWKKFNSKKIGRFLIKVK